MVQVVGLGTQDSLDEAHDFVNDRGTTFTMLWDESFEGWQALGISSQPSAVLLDTDGSIIAGWIGGFPEDEVLALAG